MKTLLVLIILLVSTQVYSQRIVKNYCNKWENSYKEKGTTETIFTWNFDKNSVKQKTDGKTYETLILSSVYYNEDHPKAFMIFDINDNSLGITKIAKMNNVIYVYYGNKPDDPFIMYYVSNKSNNSIEK